MSTAPRSVLRLIGALVLLGAAVASALLITAEQPVDPPIIGGAGFEQQNPRIATDGTRFLVTWSDARREFIHNISVARIDPDGGVVDPTGIQLFADQVPHSAFSNVAFGSGEYLVAWDSYDFTRGVSLVEAARIASDGTLLDATPRTLTSGFAGFVPPGVAFANGRFLVSFLDGQKNGRVEGAFVELDGGVFPDAGPFIIAATGAPYLHTAATSSPNQFLVVFARDLPDGGSHLYGTRVLPDGGVLDAPPLAISTAGADEAEAAATFTGGNYLVVWSDARNGTRDIYAARVALDGGVLDPNGLPIALAPGEQRMPAIAATPSGARVMWRDGRTSPDDLFGAELDVAGNKVSQFGPISASFKSWPAIACIGESCLGAWEDTPSSGTAPVVVASPLAVDGGPAVPSGLPIVHAANAQTVPSVIAGAGRFLLVFVDGRAQQPRIFRVLYDASGTALTAPAPLAPVISDVAIPAVASGPNQFAVVWARPSGDIALARIVPDGGVLDPGGFPVSIATGPDARNPAVGSNGNSYLAAWEDDRKNVAFSQDIFAERISADGGLLDPANLRLTTDGGATWPAIASDGADYLVVWAQLSTAIEGARVTGAGALLDVAPLRIAGGTAARSVPSVAFDGTHYWVVWEDDADAGVGNPAIFGARVMPDGGVLDPGGRPLAAVGRRSVQPRVQSVGGETLLVWQDDRTGTFDVYGAHLLPDGGVLEPGGFLLAGEPGDKRRVGAASLGSGDWMVAYSRFDPTLGAGRVETRMYLPDASVIDAGPPDAGQPDAGEVDAGPPEDAGAVLDGGAEPAHLDVGCGCLGGGGGIGAGLFLALLLPLALRRRS